MQRDCLIIEVMMSLNLRKKNNHYQKIFGLMMNLNLLMVMIKSPNLQLWFIETNIIVKVNQNNFPMYLQDIPVSQPAVAMGTSHISLTYPTLKMLTVPSQSCQNIIRLRCLLMKTIEIIMKLIKLRKQSLRLTNRKKKTDQISPKRVMIKLINSKRKRWGRQRILRRKPSKLQIQNFKRRMIFRKRIKLLLKMKKKNWCQRSKLIRMCRIIDKTF